MRIAVINYGMGNLGSVVSALEWLGVENFASSEPTQLASADAYILPGVGAFVQAMENLTIGGLDILLHEQVRGREKPFLGICLGMQLLAEDSVEFGFTRGLGWIKGHIVPISTDSGVQVPHVGWNQIRRTRDCVLFDRIGSDAHFYFDHSFHFECDEPDVVTAICDYGGDKVATLQKGHIFACQYHPEKSQRNGLKLLRNFLKYVEGR